MVLRVRTHCDSKRITFYQPSPQGICMKKIYRVFGKVYWSWIEGRRSFLKHNQTHVTTH